MWVRRRFVPRFADPTVYVVQVHRSIGDTWHSFTTVREAGEYALEVLDTTTDGSAYPLAIWHEDQKFWRPHGRNGKLNVAMTRDSLRALLIDATPPDASGPSPTA